MSHHTNFDRIDDKEVITYRGEYIFLTLEVLFMIYFCLFGVVQVWFVVLTTLITLMCLSFWKEELQNRKRP